MFRGFLNYTSAKVFAALAQMFLIALLSDRLSAEDIALLGFIWVSNPLLFRLLSMGADVGLSVLFLDQKSSGHLFVSSVVPFLLNILILAVIFLSLPYYNFFLFGTDTITRMLIVAWIIISGLHNHLSNFLVLSNKSRKFALLNALPIFLTALTFFTVSDMISIKSYLLSLGGFHLLFLLIISFDTSIDFTFDINASKKMVSKGIYSVPGGVIVFLLVGFDRFVLEKNVSVEDLALYVLIYKLSEGSVSLMGSSLAKSFFPWQNSLLRNSSEVQEREKVEEIVKLSLYISVSIMSLLRLFDNLLPWILGFVLSTDSNLEFAAYLFVLVSSGLILNTSVALVGNNYIITDRVKEMMIFSALAAVLNVLLNVLLIPMFGLTMAAYTTLASYSLLLALVVCYSKIDVKAVLLPAVLLIMLVLLTASYNNILTYSICFFILVLSVNMLRKSYTKVVGLNEKIAI